MRTRGLVVVVAVLLALGATAVLYLYVHNATNQARQGGALTTVVVSKVTIPAGTELDALISQGQFTTLSVPTDSLVPGAVTNLAQLKGQTTAYPILAKAQISTSEFSGTNSIPGGPLGIPKGYQAVTLSLNAPQDVAGLVTKGDHVVVYATVSSTTVTLVPSVQVLQTFLPGQAPTGTATSTAGAGNILVTLALTPAEAAKVILANQSGTVTLALLPPNQPGVAQRPITIGQLTK